MLTKPVHTRADWGVLVQSSVEKSSNASPSVCSASSSNDWGQLLPYSSGCSSVGDLQIAGLDDDDNNDDHLLHGIQHGCHYVDSAGTACSVLRHTKRMQDEHITTFVSKFYGCTSYY